MVYETFIILFSRKHLILLFQQTINKEMNVHAKQAVHVETAQWTHTHSHDSHEVGD